jgi:hypothetical protein
MVFFLSFFYVARKDIVLQVGVKTGHGIRDFLYGNRFGTNSPSFK